MPFYYRKSMKIGPLRLNFSKSGVGLSAGVKGLRVSTNNRGTYLNAGGNGLYYRQKIAGPWGRGHGGSAASSSSIAASMQSVFTQISGVPIEQLTTREVALQLEAINRRIWQFHVAPWPLAVALVIACITAIASTWAITILIVLFGGWLAGYLGARDDTVRTTLLEYPPGTSTDNRYVRVQSACEALASAERIWEIVGYRADLGISLDQAGYLPELLSREPGALISSTTRQPPYLEPNLQAWQLVLPTATLVFLPDYLLVLHGSRYGAVPYRDLRVTIDEMYVAERDEPPHDARVTAKTWRYATKAGGPDLRYRNNEQFYLVDYGRLHLTSVTGLDLWLLVSSQPQAEEFVSTFSVVS